MNDHVFDLLDGGAGWVPVFDFGAPLVVEVDHADADQRLIDRVVTLVVLFDGLPK